MQKMPNVPPLDYGHLSSSMEVGTTPSYYADYDGGAFQSSRELFAVAVPYVLGGTDANPGEFPHQAVFSYERSGKTISCGASIIHPLLLLTAAHCVYGNINPETISAFTGEQDRRQHEGTEQSHPVRSIIVHEQFNTSTLDNDVAILTLQNPIKLTNFTKIIRTASPDERVPDGAYVSGWGQTLRSISSRILQRAWVPFHDRRVCQDKWSESRQSVTNNMICAGDNKRDSCKGDSGGPLTCSDENGDDYLCGIVSWGGPCDLKHLKHSNPGVYVDVRKYHAWIQNQVQEVAGLQERIEGPAKCGNETIVCEKSGICIPESFKCNGENNCSDGSDERNCEEAECTRGSFYCRFIHPVVKAYRHISGGQAS